MSEVWIIRSTFASKDEAISTARTLLEERRIACANIGDETTSLYRWEGTIQQEAETAVIFKTTKTQVAAVIARIKALHSYQVPAIVAWPTPSTSDSFAHWVKAEVDS